MQVNRTFSGHANGSAPPHSRDPNHGDFVTCTTDFAMLITASTRGGLRGPPRGADLTSVGANAGRIRWVIQILSFTTCLIGSEHEARGNRTLSGVSKVSQNAAGYAAPAGVRHDRNKACQLAQLCLPKTNLSASYASNRYCCNTIRHSIGTQNNSHFQPKFKTSTCQNSQ